MDLALLLRGRNGAELTRLIDQGHRLSPEDYAARFGPDPGLVAAASAQLRQAGLHASWSAGDTLLHVSGTAAAVERALGVRIEGYQGAAESHFYAPVGAPKLTGALGDVVQSVIGLDNYSKVHTLDSPSLNGYTPTQVLGAYNFGPLYSADLKGQDQTVVFLEVDQFLSSDLNGFSNKFGLPAATVSVHSKPDWGHPDPVDQSGSESDLDLEIVHAVAPSANLVYYGTEPTLSTTVLAAQQAIADYPHAVFSVSLGQCELDEQQDPTAQAWDSVFQRLAATGGTAFVSSGDSGAFSCVHSQGKYQSDAQLNVSVPGSDPWVTTVGGTSLFVGSGDTYGSEGVWANTMTQWGGTGGLSTLFPRPSWQAGPGVQNQYSNGKRQVPDVSAVADGNTGWQIDTNGKFSPVGGTSAAAPLWAALAALTNEALQQHDLPAMGFANPMIYYFGTNASALPGAPFHDVTQGNNLYYPATPGWDFATGWGSPDAAAFVDDALAYRSAQK